MLQNASRGREPLKKQHTPRAHVQYSGFAAGICALGALAASDPRALSSGAEPVESGCVGMLEVTEMTNLNIL